MTGIRLSQYFIGILLKVHPFEVKGMRDCPTEFRKVSWLAISFGDEYVRDAMVNSCAQRHIMGHTIQRSKE